MSRVSQRPRERRNVTPATTKNTRTKKADQITADPEVEDVETTEAAPAPKRAAAKRAPAKKKKSDDVVEEDAAAAAEGSEDAAGDEEEDDAKPAFTEPLPTGAIVISSKDDEEVPVYSTQITGATADPVKDYLKQIGKVALLNAAEEVELAMRIEAGLFAEEKLSAMSPPRRRASSDSTCSGSPVTASARRATSSARTSVSSSPSPSATPVAACSSWT